MTETGDEKLLNRGPRNLRSVDFTPHLLATPRSGNLPLSGDRVQSEAW